MDFDAGPLAALRILWRSRETIFGLSVFLYFGVKGILLVVVLLWLCILIMIFLRDIIIVTVFPAVLAIALNGVALNTCPISFLSGWVAKLFALHLIHRSFLHDLYRFIVIEVSLILMLHWIVVALFIVVIFLLNDSLRSIVSLFVVPSQGKRAGASWSLYYLFVGLAIKISVVRTIFIEHDTLRYRNIIKEFKNNALCISLSLYARL